MWSLSCTWFEQHSPFLRASMVQIEALHKHLLLPRWLPAGLGVWPLAKPPFPPGLAPPPCDTLVSGTNRKCLGDRGLPGRETGGQLARVCLPSPQSQRGLSCDAPHAALPGDTPYTTLLFPWHQLHGTDPDGSLAWGQRPHCAWPWAGL